jgi:hypothetical protein
MSILWKKQCEMQMMIADSVDFEIFVRVLYVWRTFFTLCNVSDVGHWWLLT